MQYKITRTDSLSHHGILGMKWGKRNGPPYPLTPGDHSASEKKAGWRQSLEDRRRRKKIEKLQKSSGDKVYKVLKKEVQKERAKIHGGSNRWMRRLPIGNSSQELIESHDKKRKDYYNSKQYKEWEKKYNDYEKKAEKQIYSNKPFDWKKYDSDINNLLKERPKKSFNDVGDWAMTYGPEGRRYLNDYINKGGKDLSLAYLKDLGYDEKVASNLIKRMALKNRTLADS